MVDPVLARLSRVEGQIKALKKMYVSKRACLDIVQQIQASRAALGKVALHLLSDEAKRCADAGDVKELRRIVEQTFKYV